MVVVLIVGMVMVVCCVGICSCVYCVEVVGVGCYEV